MLNSHPRIAIPPESHLFTNIPQVDNPWEIRWSQSEVEAPIRAFFAKPKVASWGLSVDAVLETLPSREQWSYGDALAAIYAKYAHMHNKPRWGDKSPVNTFDSHHLMGAFPDAHFLHIVRDGRDVAQSWARVDWAGYEVDESARRWKVWVACGTRCAQLGPSQYLRVRYEDLVRAPEELLREICAFLGEEWSPAMLDYCKHSLPLQQGRERFHHGIDQAPQVERCFAWQREMSAVDQSTFEKIAGRTLLEQGYSVSRRTRAMALARRVLAPLRRLTR